MLASLLLIGALLPAQSPAADDDEARLAVRRLVQQLNAAQLAERDQAEAQLLQRGPAVLDLLPPTNERTPAEIQQRLGRVRQKLQQMEAEAVGQASRVTLQADALPISQALAALSQQTGNPIVDFRRRFGQEQTDRPVRASFQKAPFWPALDNLLDQAQLTVYGYGEQSINVIARTDTQVARSGTAVYSGPFRVEPLSITAERDLRNPAGRSLEVKLGAAWEPRLQPIYLKQRMAEVEAVDEHGKRLALENPAAEPELAVGRGAISTELALRLVPPPREVQRIARLRGKMQALLPGRVETYRFENVSKAVNTEKRIAAVTVVIEGARQNEKTWEIRVRVRFDQPGAALESHRGWIYRNEAYLEAADGKPLRADGTEMTRQGEHEFGIAYLFSDLPGPPGTFVYKTPGTILSLGIDYEFKDLPLP